MREFIKAINVFLSAFNLALIDLLPDNLCECGIVMIIDSKGNIVGSLNFDESLKKYIIKVDSPLLGHLEAIATNNEIKQITEDEPTVNHCIFEYTLSELKDKSEYDALSGKMSIISVNQDGETSFHISNGLFGLKENVSTPIFCFENNYPTFDYSIECGESSICFNGRVNSLVPMSLSYCNGENDSKFEIGIVTKDEKGNDVDPYIALDHSFDTHLPDTGIIGTHKECPIDDMDSSLITFFYDNLTIYNPESYELIEKVRKYTKFGKACILDNILALSTLSSEYSPVQIQSMYGFVPSELKSTPKILDNGTVLLPNFKGNRRKKNKIHSKIEGTE